MFNLQAALDEKLFLLKNRKSFSNFQLVKYDISVNQIKKQLFTAGILDDKNQVIQLNMGKK